MDVEGGRQQLLCQILRDASSLLQIGAPGTETRTLAAFVFERRQHLQMEIVKMLERLRSCAGAVEGDQGRCSSFSHISEFSLQFRFSALSWPKDVIRRRPVRQSLRGDQEIGCRVKASDIFHFENLALYYHLVIAGSSSEASALSHSIATISFS